MDLDTLDLNLEVDRFVKIKVTVKGNTVRFSHVPDGIRAFGLNVDTNLIYDLVNIRTKDHDGKLMVTVYSGDDICPILTVDDGNAIPECIIDGNGSKEVWIPVDWLLKAFLSMFETHDF